VRIPRLYLPQPLHSGREIELNDESAHYVRSVLRLKTGAALVIFDGSGAEFSARLQHVGRRCVVAEIGRSQEGRGEPTIRIELGLGISRGERMDFAIQKAVELGVFKITPLLMTRCVAQLRGERRQQKHRHWLKIAQSASEQSGRSRVPELTPPTDLNTWLATPQGLKLILDPSAEHTLAKLEPQDEQICLLSGPEGGFSDAERAAAIAADFVPIRMGPRTLRTETAALAAITAIQTLWGDFR
jgi:16S rRNA (uracil1498-N3)-methyltransferase